MKKQTNRRSAKEIQELKKQRKGVSQEYIHQTLTHLSDNENYTTLTIISHSSKTPSSEDFRALGLFALKLQTELRADPEAHSRNEFRKASLARLFSGVTIMKGVRA